MLCKKLWAFPMGSVGIPLLNSCLVLGTLRGMWSCTEERSSSDAALLRGAEVLVMMPLLLRGPHESLRPSLFAVMDDLELVTLEMLVEDTPMTLDPNY